MQIRFTKADREVLSKLGRKAGAARAAALSPERRKEIAVRAATIRWTRAQSNEMKIYTNAKRYGLKAFREALSLLGADGHIKFDGKHCSPKQEKN